MPRKTERTILFSLQTNYPTSFHGCLHIDWPAAVLAVGHQVKFSIHPVQYHKGVRIAERAGDSGGAFQWTTSLQLSILHPSYLRVFL